MTDSAEKDVPANLALSLSRTNLAIARLVAAVARNEDIWMPPHDRRRARLNLRRAEEHHARLTRHLPPAE